MIKEVERQCNRNCLVLPELAAAAVALVAIVVAAVDPTADRTEFDLTRMFQSFLAHPRDQRKSHLNHIGLLSGKLHGRCV